MIYWLPVLAALGGAVDMTINKYLYRKYHRLTSREVNWLAFTSLVIVLLFLSGPLQLWPELTTIQNYLWPLLGVVLLAAAYNTCLGWAMEHERISEVEPWLLFSPLVNMLVVGSFYSDERSLPIYIAALVGSSLLVWTRIHRHHLTLSRGVWAVIGFILIHSMEMLLLKDLLAHFDPLSLYMIRCMGILIALTILRAPNYRLIKPHHLWYFVVIGILGSFNAWAGYTSLAVLGVTRTMFFALISPVAVYWLSRLVLKEKWQGKSIIASIVIALMIIFLH